MQDNIIKNYIYTHNQTNTVLYLKSTLDLDLSLNLKGVDCYLVECKFKIKNELNLNHYHPVKGFFHEENKKNTSNSIELNLLRKKIETLLLLKMNIELSKNEIRKKFRSEKLLEDTFAESYFFKYLSFMKQEERTLNLRIDNVLKEYEYNISGFENVSDVEKYYSHIINNVNIGAYSFISQ